MGAISPTSSPGESINPPHVTFNTISQIRRKQMADKKNSRERIDMGDFGSWSDNAERLARKARRNQRISDIKQHAGGMRRAIWDLADEPGKYIDNTKTASDVCHALADPLLSAVNFLEDNEEQWSAILMDPNHPAREDAISELDPLTETERIIQNCATAFSGVLTRLRKAYRQGNNQPKIKK